MSKVSPGLVAVVVVSISALSACPPTSDRGRPCGMRKRSDGGVTDITEREVRARAGTGAAATRDFLAFGSLDCDSLLCVRDATYTSDAGDDAPALGYCSNPCDLGAACPSFDQKLDERGDTRLNCRPLLLDEQTLEAINQDPTARDIINVRSPFFCARGSAPDAGR
ncbi:MAG: adventurous gliding motility lipoprotein CglD [Myxococcaceae bacterium]|nr:adventurous gliding motility lipoprotein CglD [Myxococcaceae bacterium]